MTVIYRYQSRRRTAANWTSGNEVLYDGEIGYETDTGKFKIGDGVTAWNSIADYFEAGAGGGGGGTWGSITGTLSNQTDLNTALSGKVATTVTVNGQALSGNVTLTTAHVADSSNKRYVTDAQLTVIGNTSGTNTGDQTNISGNAATVTTNADLTGHVTSVGNSAVLGSFTVAQLNTALSDGDIVANAAVGADSLAILGTAAGVYSVAVGVQSSASAYSTAVGYQAAGSGQFSTAVGYVSAASGYASTVLGSEASATAANSVAIGSGVANAVDHTVSIGPCGLIQAEVAAAPTPPANSGVIYCEDDGTGFTKLMAKFNTGAATQLAVQPGGVAAGYQPLNSNLTTFAGLGTSLQQWRTNAGATAGEWFTPAAASGDVVGPASSTDNAIARFDSTTGKLLQDMSKATIADTGALTITPDANATAITVASHTQTASNPAISVAQTWNNAGVTFIGKTNAFTNTASAATSKFEVWSIAGTEYFALRKDGLLIVENGIALRNYETTGFFNGGGVWQYLIGSTVNFYFNSGEMRIRQNYSLNYMASGGSLGGTVNASFAHCGDNAFIFADSASPAAGATKSRQEKNKQVTAIADATATTVFTVTVPNAAHSAMIKVTLAGSIGAGGAIGVNEATGTISYDIAIARTAGVNAVATISAAYGSVTSAVAGATTITVAGDLGAVSGAVGASNTFTIRVTITKGGGSSANHTCMAYARVLNANATGITIS